MADARGFGEALAGKPGGPRLVGDAIRVVFWEKASDLYYWKDGRYGAYPDSD